MSATLAPPVVFNHTPLQLTDQELAEFQVVVDWKTGLELPDGRVLGVAGKRGKVSKPLDFRVRKLAEEFGSADKRVLEFGCLEGVHTVQLAGVCREVVALDVRPRNIACTLVRCFVHKSDNVSPVLGDARHIDESLGHFDIIFHVGVLYHLMDPVSHIMNLARMTDVLLLDTHYCLEDTTFPRCDIRIDDKVYQAYAYGEKGWKDPFSGVEPESLWLHRQALLDVLTDAGFTSLEVFKDRIERNGPRISIMASR